MTQRLAATGLILISAILAAACGSGGNAREQNANAADAAPTINITVGKSESRDIAAVIQSTGSLVAEESSNVAPKVAGKVSNISVNVGQFVAQGAIIARIDDRDARLQLASAQAAVKQAQAGVKQAEARLGLLDGGRFEASTVPEVRAAKANYDQLLAEQRQAETNEKRYRELTETGDVAMMQYEQYRTQRDTARARSVAAKQQLDAAVNTARQSNQAIVSAQAAVEAARTQIAMSEQAIADTVIRAPFSGFVSERQTAVGEFVNSASIVATILRTNPIKVQIRVNESDVPFVAVGRGVSVAVEAYKDRNFAGTVSAIDPAVDPTSRAAMVEALIENGDNALRSGMFATVKITREGGTKGVFVPRSAIYADQPTQGFRVFVIEEGIAKLKTVQIGTEEGEYQQIVSGLDPDQTVATSNLEQLYEGAKVAF